MEKMFSLLVLLIQVIILICIGMIIWNLNNYITGNPISILTIGDSSTVLYNETSVYFKTISETSIYYWIILYNQIMIVSYSIKKLFDESFGIHKSILYFVAILVQVTVLALVLISIYSFKLYVADKSISIDMIIGNEKYILALLYNQCILVGYMVLKFLKGIFIKK